MLDAVPTRLLQPAVATHDRSHLVDQDSAYVVVIQHRSGTVDTPGV